MLGLDTHTHTNAQDAMDAAWAAYDCDRSVYVTIAFVVGFSRARSLSWLV